MNISEATLYRWKQQYGAMELAEAKELKAPRDENARLGSVFKPRRNQFFGKESE